MKTELNRRYLPPGNTIFYLCIGYYLIMCFTAPGFFSINNSWNLLFNLLPLLIAAIGQTYVMLTAGIDLSVTSVVAITSVIGGYIMSEGSGLEMGSSQAILLGILAMIAGGALIGLINGLAIAILTMPAFMVTLTTMMFFSGFSIWITKSQNIYNLPEAFVNMPYTTIIGLPIPLIIGMIILVLAYLLLGKTLWGEWIYAVGLNPKASAISGIKVRKTILSVYIFSGICAAISSIFYTARLETGSPIMGQNILLDVIGAVVIGGTSLFGGKGKILWTLYGALFITLLDNSLNLLGLSYFLIMMVKGMVILMASMLNAWKKRSLSTT